MKRKQITTERMQQEIDDLLRHKAYLQKLKKELKKEIGNK